MARVNPIQTSVNAGEFSPRMAARVDFSKYPNGAAALRNLIPLPQGGAMRRPGTRFVAEVKDSAAQARLLRFEFSDEQAYQVEAGAGYFRFYRNQGRIVVAGTDAAISNGTFTSNIAGWTDRSIAPGSISHDAVAGRLNLHGVAAATDVAWAEQSVSITDTVAERALTFTVVAGVVMVRVGTTSKGAQLVADAVFQAGQDGAVRFTPGTSPYYVQFRADQPGIAAALDDVKIFGIANTGTITNGDFPVNISGWTNRSEGAGSIAWNAGGYMDLIVPTVTPVGAWAEQSVATTNINQEHVLRFEVHGIAGDEVFLRVGTTSQGNEIVDDVPFRTGFHCFAFTPTASPFYVQFRNERDKIIQVDNVSLIDNAPVEVTTPYASADVAKLFRAQTADVMYLSAGGAIPTYKLQRSGHSSWSVVEVEWLDGPWLEENLDAAKTLSVSAADGTGVTVSAGGHAPFKSTDIGRPIRITHDGSEPGYAVITGFTSGSGVTADVKRKFASVNASSEWRLGAWSKTTGYPRAIAFFEQRLIAANTLTAPQGFWGSQSADFENMRPDSFEGTGTVVEDDDALAYTIAAEDVNPIRWLSPGTKLVMGTEGGEWAVDSDGPVVTPADINVRRQTTYGSDDLRPLRIGNVVVFVQRAKRKLRDLAFSFEIEGFRAADLTVLSEHITESGLVEIAYQQEPFSTVWCVRTDGRLAVLTYRRDEDVVGWAQVELAGAGLAESVSVIPGNAAGGSDDRDEVWVVVKRIIGGQTKRYVEFFEGDFVGPKLEDYADAAAWEAAVLAAQPDAFYVDSGLTYDGALTTTITGLDHLEGATVKVLRDGAVEADKTVTAGAITLETAGSKVHVGLGYSHRYKSLKLAFGAVAGTALAKTKRVQGVAFALLDAAEGAISVGPDRNDTKPLVFREVGDPMDTAVPLFTGETFIEFDGDWQSDPRIVVQGDAPLPFTMLSILPEMKTNDVL